MINELEEIDSNFLSLEEKVNLFNTTLKKHKVLLKSIHSNLSCWKSFFHSIQHSQQEMNQNDEELDEHQQENGKIDAPFGRAKTISLLNLYFSCG